jgi:flagellar M-ring protein FliF
MALTAYTPGPVTSRAAAHYKQSWQRFSSGFTPGQKAVTAVALLGVIAAVVVLASLMSSTSYQPLFTGLQPASAAAIVNQLQSSKVPYKLADGGATVLVPASEVDQERLALAADGLPQAGSGAGLSILDKEGITTSQFTQQADYQRAVQDELANTIDSIQGIASSQVEVVMPSQSAFALGNSAPPSASVMVDLQPGASLTQGQVSSIAHLVASAVPGLNAGNVTVADNNGDLLYGPGAPSTSPGSSAAAESFDSAEEASLQSMLDQIVGPGNATVRVSAVLETASTKTSVQGVQLGKGGVPASVPTQVSSSKETFSGPGGALGGVLGTNTVSPVGGGKTTYSKTSTQQQYETGIFNTTTDQPPGQVKSQSVSVVLSSLPKGASLAGLRQAVSAAAGLTKADTLSVVVVPFSKALQDQAAAAAKAQAAASAKAQLYSLVKVAVVVLAIATALVVLWRKSRKKGPAGPELLAKAPVVEISGPPTQELPALGQETRAEEPQWEPDEVARVLRSWLSQGSAGSGHHEAAAS